MSACIEGLSRRTGWLTLGRLDHRLWFGLAPQKKG